MAAAALVGRRVWAVVLGLGCGAAAAAAPGPAAGAAAPRRPPPAAVGGGLQTRARRASSAQQEDEKLLMLQVGERAASLAVADRATLARRLAASRQEGEAGRARGASLEALLAREQQAWKQDRHRLQLLQQHAASELAEDARKLNASQAQSEQLELSLESARAEAGRASGRSRRLLKEGQARLHEAAERLRQATARGAALEAELQDQKRATEKAQAKEADEARRLNATNSELKRVRALLSSMQERAAAMTPQTRSNLDWEDAA